MEISKAKVITSYDLKDFENKINNLLNKGYKISSNMAVTPDKDLFIIMGK